jgi:hypothetical protein
LNEKFENSLKEYYCIVQNCSEKMKELETKQKRDNIIKKAKKLRTN